MQHEEPEPDLRQRIALFTRTDLAVTDADRLRSAAASRLSECCGELFDDIESEVAHPANAVSHLVGHEPTLLEPNNAEKLEPNNAENEARVRVALGLSPAARHDRGPA